MKFQYCLSERPNRPCYIVKFKQATLMLDCSLDLLPVLNFMPIPLVHSPRLSVLTKFNSKDKPELEGEIRESTLQGRFFIDNEPEFGVPDFGVIDFAGIDAILISNYTTMLALPQGGMQARRLLPKGSLTPERIIPLTARTEEIRRLEMVQDALIPLSHDHHADRYLE